MISYNYNVPVLVSNADGFKEFTKEGVTGYSFDLNKSGDLEAVLQGCILNHNLQYTELKEKLSAYVSDNFSVPSLTAKYNEMFSKVNTKD